VAMPVRKESVTGLVDWFMKTWALPLSEEEKEGFVKVFLGIDSCDAFGGVGIDWSDYFSPYYGDEESFDACVKELEDALKYYLMET